MKRNRSVKRSSNQDQPAHTARRSPNHHTCGSLALPLDWRGGNSPSAKVYRVLIYPAIDLRGGQCVRLRQGDYARETVFGADPVAMARRWVEQGACYLHLVDLDGAREGRPVNGDSVRAIAAAAGVDCRAGRRPAQRSAMWRKRSAWGVARVILGTGALRPGLGRAHEPAISGQGSARYRCS